METEQLLQLVVDTLNDSKAKEVTILNVSSLTQITEYMVICSGSSNRHVKSISDHIYDAAKKANAHIIGVEGEQVGEWVLVDLDSVIVHIMLPRTRDFYQLEKLWDFQPETSE